MTPHIVLMLATLMVGVHSKEKKDIFDDGMYLARAKAVSISHDGPQLHCVFEIEYVYVGAGSLKGKRFEFFEDVTPFTGSGIPNWLSPAPTKGEVSIWWVADRPADKKMWLPGKQVKTKYSLVAAENNPKMPRVPFPPGRKGVEGADSGDRWYKRVEKYALAIERAYRASGKERIEILKECCRSDEPVLQGWTLNNLELSLSETDYIAFLTQLAATTPLSLWMEYIVDSELREKSPAWRGSKCRSKFFQRWMNGKLKDGEAEQDENMIEYSLARTSFVGFSYPEFFRLMIDGLTTDRRSDRFKKELLDLYYWNLKDLASVDAGFAYLISQIRDAAPDRRLAASQLLIQFVPLCKSQGTAVQTLLANPAYKPIAPHLVKSLQQTKVVLDGLAGNDGQTLKRPKEFLWVRLLRRTTAPQAIRFIREHVRPSLAADPARIRQLAQDLDHDKFNRREAASRELERMGLEAEQTLSTLLPKAASVELRRRLNELLTRFKRERIITLRSIEVLAYLKTPESRELLQKLAGGVLQSPITRLANKALKGEIKRPPPTDE